MLIIYCSRKNINQLIQKLKYNINFKLYFIKLIIFIFKMTQSILRNCQLFPKYSSLAESKRSNDSSISTPLKTLSKCVRMKHTRKPPSNRWFSQGQILTKSESREESKHVLFSIAVRPSIFFAPVLIIIRHQLVK